MKKLLRSRRTQAFYKEGLWVNDHRQAQEFTDVIQAMQLVAQQELADVDFYVVCQSEPSESDYCIHLA